MTDSITETKLSRRQFVGGTVAGAAALGAIAGATALVPKAGAVPKAEERKEEKSFLSSTSVARNPAAPIPVPSKWTYSSDVVILGYGSAGGYAAISAYDAGAEVLILEKTPSLASLGVTNNQTYETMISGGGGNSHISGGGALTWTDPINGAIWHNAMSYGATPMEVSQAFSDMAVQTQAYMESLGLTAANGFTWSSSTSEYANFPSAATAGLMSCSPAKSGMQHFYYVDQLVTVKRGIPVLFNTRATALIQNPTTGEVLGVQALQNQSETVTVQDKRGVIIATGGFEFDHLMMLNYCKMAPYHFGGWQYNTGDGIKMAMAAGAGLWHMNTTSGRLSPWIPTYNMAWAQEYNGKYNYVWTDRYGNRYCNETGLTGHSAWQANVDWNFQYGEYSRVPSMSIFDSTVYNAGIIAWGEGGKANTGINAVPVQLGGTGAGGNFAGSAVGTAWTNAAMVSAGYIIQGQTITALAANIASAAIVGSNQGMTTPAGWDSYECMDNVTMPIVAGGQTSTSCPHYSASNLQAAVNQWNTDCAAGKGDTVFGRSAASMAPIQTAPFYAIALWPAGPNTNGGPIRNAQGQVCDPYYNPIPRLYCDGECGSVWGFLYQGGGNWGENIAFGRITGNNSANEEPWTS